MSEIFDTSIVTDFDTPFVIEPKSREITNKNLEKKILMKNDHQSEKFTFEVPRYIEGRDIALCNVVQVIYTNSGGSKRETANGVYTVEDFRVYPFYDDIMTFTWLISQNATQYVGNLSFMLRFAQIDDNAKVLYSWQTKIFNELYIAETLDGVENFEHEYVDVIQQWKNTAMAELLSFVDISVKENVNVAQIDVNKQNISELTSEQAVMKSRMDGFTALGEGSTTGDAELADIRIDMNGRKHTTAGNATREQCKMLDNVKQKAYGSFEALEGIIHEGVVYEVVSKVEQSIDGGFYGSYNVAGETMLLVSGFSWSSYSVFPLAAFYNSAGNLIAKVGDMASKTFSKLLCYVPTDAATMIVNGKNWYEPAVEKFVAGDLETDINEIHKLLSADIPVSKLANYIETEEMVETIALSSDNTELLEAQMYKTEGGLTTGVLSGATYDTLYFPIGIYTAFKFDKYAIGVYGGAFVDSNKKWISSFNTSYPNNLEKKIVPEGAYYLALTVNAAARYKDITVYHKSFNLKGLKVHDTDILNVWKGKKVVWLGTSVPFGQYATKSYAHEASKHLGFELVNCSTPGIAIHTGSTGGTMTYGSLTLSKSEYLSLGWGIPDAPVAYKPGGSYNDYYRTYENIFCEENADADLYVFDVVPNNSNFDMSDWNMFDFKNWKYTDGSSFEDHRKTFLGALLFLMDKMYALNENARMIFVLGSGFSYWEGKTALKAVSEKWNIPVIDVWSKMNISPKSLLKIFSDNGTNGHPSTYGHELMGKMLAHELKGVC